MNNTRSRLVVLALAFPCALAFGQEPPEAPKPDSPTVTTRVEVITASPPSPEVRLASRAETMEASRTALEAAEKEQRAALEAVAAAREELIVRAQEAREAEAAGDTAERARQHELHREEFAEIRRELERAYSSLRNASREVTRVHRNLNRAHLPRPPTPSHGYSYRTGDRAVIGVILGGSDKDGVRVLGVSPDGPAERAGLTQDDVIVSVMGTPLAGEGQDARSVLLEVLQGVNVGDELEVTVERDGETRSLTVVPEEREPFTWSTHSRLGDVPFGDAPQVFVERIEVPEIDRESLRAEMDRLREHLDHSRVIINDEQVVRIIEDGQDLDVDVQRFSGFGDAMLAGTNAWFGMPLVRGLKLAEINDDLGDYFSTDTGVLVLVARADNELQLRPGDVILAVGGNEVTKPSDVMRALRGLETGSELDIRIMRKGKDQTLVVEVPESRYSFRIEVPHPD